MIIIHPYDPTWPAQFEAARRHLAESLGDLALRIDHIGSTSVPGLGAKDIIDIQITVRELAPDVRERLVAAGYRQWPYFSDHVPPGEDEAPHLWAKFLFHERDGERPANIHMRVQGNPNQRYALLFRDYLRAHPASARTIERIKRELARYHPDDKEAYYDIKDPVYDLIWAAAKEWAHWTHWKPDEA